MRIARPDKSSSLRGRRLLLSSGAPPWLFLKGALARLRLPAVWPFWLISLSARNLQSCRPPGQTVGLVNDEGHTAKETMEEIESLKLLLNQQMLQFQQLMLPEDHDLASRGLKYTSRSESLSPRVSWSPRLSRNSSVDNLRRVSFHGLD